MFLIKITLNNAMIIVPLNFCHMLNWQNKKGQDSFEPYFFVNKRRNEIVIYVIQLVICNNKFETCRAI
jgi:hypothetical protein